MRLKKLVLQGFKSFKDKTSVYFDDGVTGIIGPNGCGKSNIVDALFWVMGEQSAKHLRGKSMKDLIFAGSAKYGPGAFAEVDLVLENTTEKHIHVGKKMIAPKEIQISRKLYRNGDSEYRINGMPARLRDIQEVFMDTGAGAKSYSVIAQGEIDRLVQAKPEERRTMIEEVAGITKFKLRKRESLRKIEQTNLNLNRLKDLQSEIHKNLKSLERQAEKAEKARSLKKKIEKTDLIVNSHREFDLLKNFADFNHFIGERKLKVAEWEMSKQSLEVGLEQERVQKTNLVDQIETEQRDFNEQSKRLAGSEEKLNYMRRTQTEKLSLIEMKVKENTTILEETKERKNKLQNFIEQLQVTQTSKVDREGHSKLQLQTQETEEKLELKEKKLEKLRIERDRDQNDCLTIEQELFKMNLKASELAQNLQDIFTEMEVIEKQYSNVSDETSQERSKVNAAKQQVQDLEQILEKLNSQAKELAREKKQLEQEVHQLAKETIAKTSKLESLQTLNKNHEDQEDGVRALLKNYPGDCSLFADLVKCYEKKYLPAVQTALKARLNSVVLGDDVTGNNVLMWLEQKKLNANFLTPCVAGAKDFIPILGTRPLLDIVELNDAYRPLLEGIYIADQIDETLLRKVRKSEFAIIVSQDGKRVVENWGNSLKVSGFYNDSEGGQTAIARNNLIRQLQIEESSLNEVLEKKREELLQIEQKHKVVNETRDTRREEFFQAQIALASLRSSLDTKLDNLATGNSRMNILQERKQTFSQERMEILEREEREGKDLDKMKKIVGKKNMAIEGLKREAIELRLEHTQLKEKLFIKEMEVQTFDDRVNSLCQQISDLEEQVERNLKRLQANNEIVSKYELELAQIEKVISDLQEHNSVNSAKLAEREQKLSEIKDELSGLLIKMQEREDEVKKLSYNINKNEKEIIAKETKRDQIIIDEEQVVRNIFEKYQIDLRDEIAKFFGWQQGDLYGLANISEMYQEEGRTIPTRSYEFQRKYGQDLKDQKNRLQQYKQALNRIGEINWQAIEDYDRQKVRYRFLKQQEAELRTSVVDLGNAIAQIDKKSRMRFKFAFEEVSSRFEKVFPIIFGGGNARLKLVGSIDDPECGVDIIAQPPGKKMQSVGLMSGGEKALTAVSLIFSTFLVKPSPFCLLDEVDAPLDDANVGRFNELLMEMSGQSQFILITHNKKTMEFNNTLYGVTMQEPGISTAVSVHLQ